MSIKINSQLVGAKYFRKLWLWFVKKVDRLQNYKGKLNRFFLLIDRGKLSGYTLKIFKNKN